jgi:hypothetical protein
MIRHKFIMVLFALFSTLSTLSYTQLHAATAIPDDRGRYMLFGEAGLFERRLNVEFMPLGLATGEFRGSAIFDVTPHNSFGLVGSIRQASWSKERLEGGTFGLVGTHRVYDRTLSSPLMRLELERGMVRREPNRDTSEGSWDFPYSQVRGLVGYNWLWLNGLNLTLAAGAGYVSGDLRSEDPDLEVKVFRGRLERGNVSLIYPAIELALGYKL